jgi:serine protease Do
LIAGTQPGSHAAKAGLKAGDVITAVNGSKVTAARDLARQVAGIAPNAAVAIDFLREGKAQTAQVTTGELKDQRSRERPRAPQPDAQTSRLGIAVAPVARVMGIGEEGLAVVRIDPGGKATEAGLHAGNVILDLGGKQVSSPEELARAVDEAARQKKKQHMLALVRRNDRQMYIALPAVGG